MTTNENTIAAAFGYFKGDKFEYTGKSDRIHGGIFYEGILVEGHRMGTAIWVVTPPTMVAK